MSRERYIDERYSEGVRWPSQPDPGDVSDAIASVASVVGRLPPRYAESLAVALATDGVWTRREVAAQLGISQPSWTARRARALSAARLAISLPDLDEEAVREALVREGHRPIACQVAARYWRLWEMHPASRELGVDGRRGRDMIVAIIRSGRPPDICEALESIRLHCSTPAHVRARHRVRATRLRRARGVPPRIPKGS